MGLRLTNNATYEWVEDEAIEIQKTIDDYKKELADTDYKIIKCTEYSMVDRQLPYDISALHQERQAVRDIINEMEANYGTN